MNMLVNIDLEIIFRKNTHTEMHLVPNLKCVDPTPKGGLDPYNSVMVQHVEHLGDFCLHVGVSNKLSSSSSAEKVRIKLNLKLNKQD